MNFVNIEYRDEDNFMLDSVNLPGIPEYCGDVRYFQVNNLFAELITEQQKQKARANLEITFDNLLGNVANTPGLDEYISNYVQWKNLKDKSDALKEIFDLSNFWKTLIVNAETKEGFEKALSENLINSQQIAFIQDTNEIWTQGIYYPCPYSKQQIDSFFETLNNKCDELESRSYTLTKTQIDDNIVKEAYQLRDKDNNVLGDTIYIYKDGSLKNVELENQKLIFTYILADNTESKVSVDFSSFILEFEFKDGFKIVDGSVYLKIDPSSESYLSVSEQGVKLSGINEKIQNSVNGLNVIAVDANETIEDPDMSYIAKDLSMFDIYGKSIDQTTANCYVVKEVGTYKFPLVYGNAIKNGEVNKIAYTNIVAPNSHSFVNYKNGGITNPYIETDTQESVVSAQLSIADTDGVFGDISIVAGHTCRYLKFTILNVPDTGANGIISIKDKQGVIMWSWHIWVWKDDLTPVTITNHTGVNYDILPVNLASKWETNSSEPTKIKNWYYKYGLATPYICTEHYNSNVNSPNYGVLPLNTVVMKRLIPYSWEIHCPNYFQFTDSDDMLPGWDFGVGYNLWNQKNITYGASDNNVVKTIYDPSPIGFTVPNGKVFSGFVKDGEYAETLDDMNVIGDFNNGFYFKRNSDDTIGVFFPASGYREYYEEVTDCGNEGYVLTSAWEDADYVIILNLAKGRSWTYVDTVSVLYSHYVAGSVRPVLEV